MSGQADNSPGEFVVSLDGLDGVFVDAVGATAAAACVIVAGSGPTDANGNNPFAPRTDNLRRLAIALATAGIASVRFDKRGVARSAAGAPPEEQMTIDAAAADVAAWANWLGGRAGRNLFLSGHSEGALLCLLAAARLKIGGVVSLCGAGRRLDAVLVAQLGAAAMPDALRANAMEVMAELVAGRRVANVDPALAALFRPSVQPYLMSIFARDPAAELAACQSPVLVVGGGRDVQVLRADFDALVAARPEAEQLWLPSMTHALQDDEDDAAAPSTASVARPLARGLVEKIIDFVAARA